MSETQKINAKADSVEDCITRRAATRSGKRKEWLYHEPCDDGNALYGKSDGFMTISKTDSDLYDHPSNFVFKCKGCGKTIPYE